MKLRNKKTGEIGNLITICASTRVFVDKKSDKVYNTLAELTNEWEDYEEPIECWTINLRTLKPYHIYDDPKMRIYTDESLQNIDTIGLKFETEEEAEKAVEKLKAWKRLKNKGFRFADWSLIDGIRVEVPDDFYDSNDLIPRNLCDDLDLLFGGEK